jgi:Tfp pilus assembly ATPase PilU
MAASQLCDFDAKLYRLYAVGALSYEDALGYARSEFKLRRALLAFDQNARSERPSGSAILPRAPIESPPAQG